MTAGLNPSTAGGGPGELLGEETLVGCLMAWARLDPGRVFCRVVGAEGGSVVTYGELAAKTTAYASRVTALGLRPGARSVVVMDTCVDAYAAFLGLELAGHTPSFMPFPNPKQPPSVFWPRHRPVFDRLEAELVITTRDCLSSQGEAPMDGLPPLLCVEDLVAHSEAGPIAPSISGDAPALLQHSSGTTGLKKCVQLSHRAVLAQARAYGAAIGFGPADVVATWLPLYHDMGLITGFLMPLVFGASVVTMSPFAWVAQPDMFLEAIGAWKATLAWLPNFAFHHLARACSPDVPFNLESVRLWINCAEPCKAEAFEAFHERFGPSGVSLDRLQVCYALAENVFAATQTAPGALPRRLTIGDAGTTLMSCGRPIPGVSIRILRDDGTEAAEGELGEVCLASEFLFDGYFREPELTAKRLRSGWYLTHDIGMLFEGELYIRGRKDDGIIVYGRNIFAFDVEALCNQVPGIRPGRCIALGIFASDLGTHELVLVAEPDGTCDERILRRNLREVVQQALAVAPRRVVLVEPGWLIKTTSGKISRQDNLEKYLAMNREGGADG